MKSPVVETNSLLKYFFVLSPALKTANYYRLNVYVTQIFSRVYYSLFKLLMNALAKKTTQFIA